MLELAGQKIFFVDSHCQWYAQDEPELFLAALSYGGYDAGFMAVSATTRALENAAQQCAAQFRICRGQEMMFSFAHIIALGYEGELPEDGDPLEKLRVVRPKAQLLLLAHPCNCELYLSGLVHQAFEEKLLDGFEYFNSYDYVEHPDSRSHELFDTYGYTPVAGCDVHNSRRRQRPTVVYTPDYPPCTPLDWRKNDIDTFGGVRTLVFAEDCTPEALADAICNGRTLVEADRKLYGNATLRELLLANGYAEVAEAQRAQRMKLAVHAAGNAVAGSTLHCTLLQDIHGRIVCLGKTQIVAGNAFDIVVPKDYAKPHLALTVFDDETGMALTSSVQLQSKIGIDLNCSYRETPQILAEIQNNTDEDVSGELVSDGYREALTVFAKATVRRAIPVHPENPAVAEKYRVAFQTADGEYACQQPLVFLRLGDEFCINCAMQIYGGLWDGIEDLSAKMRFDYLDNNLVFESEVTDPVHDQPKHSHWLFFGDSIQFGFSYDRICTTEFQYFDFQMGLTDTGAELFLTNGPQGEAEKYPVQQLLPKECCKITETAAGLRYHAVIPFEALGGYNPKKDGNLKFFIRLFNRNGSNQEFIQQVKCIMEYPLKSSAWMQNINWATLILE